MSLSVSHVSVGESWLTAAIPMDNPGCSCKCANLVLPHLVLIDRHLRCHPLALHLVRSGLLLGPLRLQSRGLQLQLCRHGLQLRTL